MSRAGLGLLRAAVLAALVVGVESEVFPAEVGEYVVVIEPTKAMIEDGSVGVIPVGVVFVVQNVKGTWLWPNLSQPGWLPQKAVVSLEAGEKLFTSRVAKNSRDVQSLWGRGEIHRARGDWEAAIRDFSEVVRLSPESHLAYLSRGVCRTEAGDIPAALEDFDRAAELAPKEAAVYQLRRRVHTALGDHEKALADATRAVELAPEDARGYNSRAWIRATCPNGRFRDGTAAVADAEAACRLTGHLNYRCLGTLAAAHAEAGDFAEAIRRQKQAVALAPEKEADAFRKRLQLYDAGKPYRLAAPE